MNNLEKAIEGLINSGGSRRHSRFSISFTEDELSKIDSLVELLNTNRQNLISTLVVAAISDLELKITEK